MIKISNIKWPYKDFDKHAELVTILTKKFLNCNIKTNIKILVPDINNPSMNLSIYLDDVIKNKSMLSTVDNKFIMNPTDPRIKKRGRNYLKTKRLTLEQHNYFFTTLQKVFDMLGLQADIIMLNQKLDIVYSLRLGLDKYDNVPKLKSFPIKFEEVV